MKRKVILTIIIILIIIVIAVTLNLTRKSRILNKYINAVEERNNSTNYYAKCVVDRGTNNEHVTELICKDKIKILKINSSDGETKMIYKDENDFLTFINKTSGEKIVTKGSYENVVPTYSGGDSYFYNIFKENKLIDKIKNIYSINITTKNYNGKNCYRFYVKSKNIEAYITKDEMICIKSSNGITNEFDYEKVKFGTVTDKDVKKPDLTEYTEIED